MPTPEKLDAPILVRFTTRDKANLARQARTYGLTLTAYIRTLALFGRQAVTVKQKGGPK